MNSRKVKSTAVDFDERDFRNALGVFGTGITVITTCDRAGNNYGVTVSSFNSVSLNPPMVLWSQGRKAPSHKAFKENPRFVVNVLSAGQSDISDQFARFSIYKFKDLQCAFTKDGIAILPGTSGHFECETEKQIEGGDHVIFLAKVLNYQHHNDSSPLFFWQGKYITPEISE